MKQSFRMLFPFCSKETPAHHSPNFWNGVKMTTFPHAQPLSNFYCPLERGIFEIPFKASIRKGKCAVINHTLRTYYCLFKHQIGKEFFLPRRPGDEERQAGLTIRHRRQGAEHAPWGGTGQGQVGDPPPGRLWGRQCRWLPGNNPARPLSHPKVSEFFYGNRYGTYTVFYS